MRALIDGDILVYRVGFACQKTHYFYGDLLVGTTKKEVTQEINQGWFTWEDVTSELIVEPIENCLHSVKVVIASIIKEVKASSSTIYLTGKNNFREGLVDYYKMNRKDAVKPHYYEDIREYLQRTWGAIMCEGQEADDALSIAQLHSEEDTVICTIDKDLKNTKGWNYNFVTKEMLFIDEEQADLNFYTQLITGDMTDNIPGFFKITGCKATAKLMEPLAYANTRLELWRTVRRLYIDEFIQMGGDKSASAYDKIAPAVDAKLTEIGQLLWMRREEGELWTPPQ